MSAYLEEHAKDQEVIETEASEKIEDFIGKITENIDDREKSEDYMWKFIEFVSGELIYEK